MTRLTRISNHLFNPSRMKHPSGHHSTSAAVLLALAFFAGISNLGCDKSSTKPEPSFDSRTVNLEVSLSTGEYENGALEHVVAGASVWYDHPMGDPGSDVLDPIKGCGLTLNDVPLPSDTSRFAGEGSYRCADTVAYQPGDPLAIHFDLPSQDDTYPSGYPTVQADFTLPSFSFQATSTDSAVSAGDTLQFTWNRDLGDQFDAMNFYQVTVSATIRSQFGYATIYTTQDYYTPSNTDPGNPDGIHSLVLTQEETSGDLVAVYIDIVTAVSHREVEVVSGKMADITVLEYRRIGRNYSVR